MSKICYLACSYRAPSGYCTRTAGCVKESGGTATIIIGEKGKAESYYGTPCRICGEIIPIAFVGGQHETICQECCRRLRRMIYPERKSVADEE